MASKKHTIDQCSAALAEAQERHELSRALREGVEAMRKAALVGKWMTPNPGEMEPVDLNLPTQFYSSIAGLSSSGITRYELRLKRSAMPNPWVETISDIARLPFRARIDLNGWDEELVGTEEQSDEGEIVSKTPGWVDNLDGSGRSLDEWAAEVFEDVLFEGVAYGLVDNDARIFADPESRRLAGARPYTSKLLRGDFRRITLEFREDRPPRLKEIVFYQPIDESDFSDPNAWVESKRSAYKVITAGDPDSPRGSEERKVRVRVYVEEENAKGEKTYVEDPERRTTIEPDDPTKELLDIPLIPFFARRIGPYEGDSPFLQTAWDQVALWNHASEMQEKGRESALSWLHESGVTIDPEDNNQQTRADTTNQRYRWTTEPGGKLDLVESEGTALSALRELVDWFSDRIRAAHRQIRSERPSGPVTAREVTLEGVHASSALEGWVILQEEGWQKVLELMALLGGLPSVGTVSIPHDFGLPSAAMERNTSLYKDGYMSPRNYWSEAKRAGDVDEVGFDYEAEEEQRARRELKEVVDAALKVRMAEDLSRETVWEILNERGALPEGWTAAKEESRLEDEAEERAANTPPGLAANAFADPNAPPGTPGATEPPGTPPDGEEEEDVPPEEETVQ